MTQLEVGLVLALVFVACAGAVLLLMEEISRDHQQGGRVLAKPPAGWTATCAVPPAPRRRLEARGRHRR